MNRRNFLKIIGGGVILVAGAGAWRVSSSPQTAHLPWEAAGNAYSELRQRALSHALLAPNPHNRQPWKVDLSTPDRVTLFVDTDRLLPHTDPFSRQIVIITDQPTGVMTQGNDAGTGQCSDIDNGAWVEAGAVGQSIA